MIDEAELERYEKGIPNLDEITMHRLVAEVRRLREENEKFQAGKLEDYTLGEDVTHLVVRPIDRIEQLQDRVQELETENTHMLEINQQRHDAWARVRKLEAALGPAIGWIEEMHATKRCKPDCSICAGVRGVLERARAALEKKA